MKIIYECFDKDTQETSIVLSTNKGDFIGTAKLHEEDADSFSYFFGCSLAENRAIIKYLKARKKELYQEIETIKKFHNQLLCYKDYDEENSFELCYETKINIIERS